MTLLADSDAVFLQSPELAFSHPGYIKTGTLFFHDRVDPGPYLSYANNVMPVHEWWHSIMHGRQPSPMLKQSQFWKGKTIHEMESGVVVVNKGNAQVLLGILFAAWMNTKKVRRTTTYRYTHGETSLQLHIGIRQACTHTAVLACITATVFLQTLHASSCHAQRP